MFKQVVCNKIEYNKNLENVFHHQHHKILDCTELYLFNDFCLVLGEKNRYHTHTPVSSGGAT